MPNHISNYVVIEGDLASSTLELLTGPDGVTFDKILPMPRELEQTVSPTEVVETDEQAYEINKEWKTIPGQPTIRAITSAEASRRRAEHGAINWYDWASERWGTKWGAYDTTRCEMSGDIAVLEFLTAWSPPIPVWEHLVEQYGVAVLTIWQDEGESGYHVESFGETNSSVFDYLTAYTTVEFTL